MNGAKILIVAPNWLGDLVMAQSLFIEIKAHNPKSRIDILAPKSCSAVAEFMTEIDNVIVLPFKHKELRILARKKFAKKLVGYDISYVLPNSLKSSLIPWFANIPVRVGWLGESRYGLLTHKKKLDKKKYPTQVQRYVEIFNMYGGKKIDSGFDRVKPPKLKIDLDGCDGYPNVVEHDKYIVVCPGAAFGRAKMYPYKHYARVISKLMQSGYILVMLGAGSDEIVGKEIEKELEKDLLADKNSFINLINKTTLKEACLVLEKARLVISNDSGLMHCSAAFGVWLVAIFGPTDTKHTPPLTKNAVLIERNLDCRPCFKRECYLKHHKCMEDISPNTVIAAVLDILDNKIIGHL